MKFEQIGECLLYLGDSRDSPVYGYCPNVVVTDPPYGVGLGVTTDARKDGHGLGKRSYASYEDTYDNFLSTVVPVIGRCVSDYERALVFCAPQTMHDLPRPNCVGGVYMPAGSGRNSWGFTNFVPAMLYGVAPELNKRAPQTVLRSTDRAEESKHPCPKPLAWMEWAVELASRSGELVYDPFMGSGTTGVACARLGRRFIGVELEPSYFDIACERIDNAYRQQRMFA